VAKYRLELSERIMVGVFNIKPDFGRRNTHVLTIRPTRILYRITIPFTLLLGLTALSIWFFSAYFITRYLDESLKQQMEQVTGIISKSHFILNPVILGQLKEVINAEIVLFDKDGRISSSTFSDSHILSAIQASQRDFPLHSMNGRDIKLGGVQYRAVIRPLAISGQEGGFFSLWMPLGPMDALRQRIVLSIGGIALLSLFAMAWISYYIARGITSPVEELVKVTARVAHGDRGEKVLLDSSDEIGTLANSFNHMIDALRNFEERLVKSEKLAAAGQLAAGFAHEIRNPLTSIKMLGQVLHKRMRKEPENQEMLASLVAEINRLDRIIQEMIDRTRPGELKRQWGDINAQVEEVVGVAEEGIRAENIAIRQNLSDNLPPVYLDQEKIKQVLWNLILNAKEAMPDGGLLIISTSASDDGFTEIAVEDTGMGISSDNVEQFFQPFFTTKPEGVGLGLTMSRKIVEQHGGKLILENRPEGGTRARVVLPMHLDSNAC
jgi:signal transduction histidine kinase